MKKQKYILKNLGIGSSVLTIGILSLLLCCIGANSTFAQPTINTSSEKLAATQWHIVNVLRESHMAVTASNDGQLKIYYYNNPGQNTLPTQYFMGPDDQVVFVSDYWDGDNNAKNPQHLLFLTRNSNLSMSEGKWKLWHTDKDGKFLPSAIITDAYRKERPSDCDQVILTSYGSKLLFGYDKQIDVFNVDCGTLALTPFDQIKFDSSTNSIMPNSIYTNNGETIVFTDSSSTDSYAKAISDDGTRMVVGCSVGIRPLLYLWQQNSNSWNGINGSGAENVIWWDTYDGILRLTDNNINHVTVHHYIHGTNHKLYKTNIENDGKITLDGCDRICDADFNAIEIIDNKNNTYRTVPNPAINYDKFQFPVVGTYNQDDRLFPIMPASGSSITALSPSLNIEYPTNLSTDTATSTKYEIYQQIINRKRDTTQNYNLYTLKLKNSLDSNL